MAKVSAWRKIEIAAQIAARRAGQSRTASAAMGGVRVAGRTMGRVGRQLWLEVTGFTFVVFAVIGGIAGFHEYVKYQAGEADGLGRVFLAACFTATFAWFGLSSFWRVRKKN